MATDEELVKFKTDAWKSTGMVAGYALRMHENRGTNRLKNQVEAALCRENLTGRRIVDVGVGTGRASLQLARDGYAVTGIDISQAMLEQCRREAGSTAIELIQGDLANLPVADEQYDSLVSLNVAVHFPNWRDALRDWARVVKPGGRLVFDVHSRDHLLAVAAVRHCAPQDLLTPAQREDAGQFMLRVTADEVGAAADECGLSVLRLIPYAAVLGGGNVNYWLEESRLWGYLGDRALSWMAADERLFDFGLFLEREVASLLSTHATGRFMIVLEKRGDPAVTHAALEYNRSMARAFAQTPRLAALREVAGDAVERWAPSFRKHLAYEKNRALLAMALSSRLGGLLHGLVSDLLGGEMTAELYGAHVRQRVDGEIHDFVRTWHRNLGDARPLEYAGIDLGPVLEYDLMRDVLAAEYFNAQAGA